MSDYDAWKLEAPEGPTAEEEDADTALDFESQWDTRNGKSGFQR